ncbi:MAG TPA: double-strand break repair protein AddB [Candidatus Binatia bacterium]|nr:double-strand break repair protein AddB [Candidatus Binatia bacterium]
MSALSLGLPEPLFGGPAPRLRYAPASAPFLDLIADAMVAELARGDDPFALSDALVLLPNRRAVSGLITAFAKRLGGAALLPAIRPLGDPQADDDLEVWGADPIAELPPPIPLLQRRLQLAALIRRRETHENGVDDPVRALALADELSKLLDGAATVGQVDWKQLPKLVEEIDLARHWASSAAFLEIITKFWPAHLEELGHSDPAEHGAAVRRALAKRWKAEAPKRAIVIAGSTGSQATTRELMRVVARLPRGVVVLPGVDVDLDDDSWRMVGDQHPQHALRDTLTALGVDRRDIAALQFENERGRARRVLMREALAPAEKTADWLVRLEAAGGEAFIKEGASNLRLLEAETEDQEATAIALLLREVLETPGGNAAVVTPDAALARRIEAKLARWGIAAAVSHGAPLRETEAGRLIALLCELARDAGEPVALAALLKHPRVLIGRDQFALTILEHNALRGPRRYDTLEDLANFGDRDPDEPITPWPHARPIVDSLITALAPLRTLMSQREVTLAAFAEALTLSAETLTADEIWQGRDGQEAASLLREAFNHGAALGLMPSYAAPRVLMKLMAERQVPPPTSASDAPIAIWGLFEARLQRRDVMILAGLNEGVWPAPVGEDPFLSRAMRAKLGLPSLDARIGLAAHDFAQLANAPNVVLSRALRRDGSPTLASRWLWRLKTLAQGAKIELARGDQYATWAKNLDEPAEVMPAPRVEPRPPADKRLKQISVTQVETLIRDPYAVYARRILKLDSLDPIGASASPAERGTAVHRAIELFGDGADPAELSRLLDEELRWHGVAPERRAADRERLLASVNVLIAWFAERRSHEAVIYREKFGKMPVGEVLLTGQADRIEIAPGHAAILDFKTGSPPSDPQVNSGLSPQLLLEAAMLMAGVIEDVPKATPTELVYWQFGGSKPAPKVVDAEGGPVVAAERALANLRSLLAKYADPQQPFFSKPRVQFLKPYDEYDLLARRKEWAAERGEE